MKKTKIIIRLKIKLRLGNVVFVQKVVWLKITKLILKTDIWKKNPLELRRHGENLLTFKLNKNLVSSSNFGLEENSTRDGSRGDAFSLPFPPLPQQDPILYREKPIFYKSVNKNWSKLSKITHYLPPLKIYGSTSALDLSRQVSKENLYSQAGPTFLHL